MTAATEEQERPVMIYGHGTKYRGRVTVHIASCSICTPKRGQWLTDDSGEVLTFPNSDRAHTFGQQHMADEHGLVSASQQRRKPVSTPTYADALPAQQTHEPQPQAQQAATGAHSGQSGDAGDPPVTAQANYSHDHGLGWDDSDVAYVKGALTAGKSLAEIAAHMGRTPKAVGSKIYRLRKAGKLA